MRIRTMEWQARAICSKSTSPSNRQTAEHVVDQIQEVIAILNAEPADDVIGQVETVVDSIALHLAELGPVH